MSRNTHPPHALVTGGAGFIGSHLVERLVREDYRVTVLDNLSRGSIDFLADVSPHITFMRGDIRERGALEAAMSGVEVVFHLAAQSSVLRSSANLDDSFGSNVVGTYQVLQAAKNAGVRRVVFTSSREVYGDPDTIPVREDAPLAPKNAYGASKLAGELYCRVLEDSAFVVSILRLANVYGPRDTDRVIPLFVEQSAAGRDLILYGGTQVLDFIWIDSVVEALLRVSRVEGRPGPINIGTGAGTAIGDLARRIVAAMDSHSRVVVAPPRSIESVRFVADPSKARAVLGLEPPADPLEHLGLLLPARATSQFL